MADAVRALVARFDPDVTLARDAMELVTVFGEIENLGAAAKAIAADKVAATELWRRKGFKSAAGWLATTTGTGMGDAIATLKTAEALHKLEATTEQFKAGKLSPRQAKAVATAAAAAPESEQELLTTATSAPVTDLETKARQVRLAASPETVDERHARLHRDRYLRTWIDQEDGAGCGQWKLPPAEHARLMAELDHTKSKIFRTARAEGRREPDEAYAVDALVAAVTHHADIIDLADTRPHEDGGGDTVGDADAGGDANADGDGSRTDADGDTVADGDGSRADRPADPRRGRTGGRRSARDVKVIVRVEASALERGHTVDGELCEIAGIGPVPVSVVQEWVEGDAFKAAIVTDGTDIRSIVHLGRRPIALQRTALEWHGANRCSIRGCTSSARLEIDHTADWADTYRTVVNDLAPVCGHHHDLKSYEGYTFGPLDPDGRRQLIPPETTQSELFDTG